MTEEHETKIEGVRVYTLDQAMRLHFHLSQTVRYCLETKEVLQVAEKAYQEFADEMLEVINKHFPPRFYINPLGDKELK
jgi:hypothetical protein